MSRVYLAGPISGLTYDGATTWRDFAEGYLENAGVRALSPLRNKEYLRTHGVLKDTEVGERILSTRRAIMSRDYTDVVRSDVLLVYLLGAKRVSMGTVMEIAWGYQARKPVVCVMERGNVHEHVMVEEAIDYRVSTLDEALELTCSVLGV